MLAPGPVPMSEPTVTFWAPVDANAALAVEPAETPASADPTDPHIAPATPTATAISPIRRRVRGVMSGGISDLLVKARGHIAESIYLASKVYHCSD